MSATQTPASPPRDRIRTGDRRVRKTRAALRDAFVSLVLEHGYDAVTIEHICDRADVARATFYAHFADKDQLLTRLFHEMTEEVTERVTRVQGAPAAPRVSVVRDLYDHALEYRDLYLICLRGAGDARPKAAYVSVIEHGAHIVFTERLRASGRDPLVPLEQICRTYAAVHVALLHDWLEREDREPSEVAAQRQQQLLGNGLMWAMQALPQPLMDAFLEPRD